MRKIASLLLALILVLSLAAPAFAQEVPTGKGGNASITISNAAKGETYTVVKLFNASVTGNTNGSIAYTGEIPTDLASYFEKEGDNIKFKAGVDQAAAFAAMKTWAEKQTATATAKADGSQVVFTGLTYGYYVVLTTQGTAVTVTSTNPTATVIDKNSTVVTVAKSVDDEDVYIGQTVTYTADIVTTNWVNDDHDNDAATPAEPRQVTKYVISDTLPAFLSDVTVTSIVVDDDGKADTTDDRTSLTVQQFDNTKTITIPWRDNAGKSLYNNGAHLMITYTATVTKKAVVDGNGNTNKVTVTPYIDDGNGGEKKWQTFTDEETIYTYAAALLKVDENRDPLAGAKFKVKGLTVEPVPVVDANGDPVKDSESNPLYVAGNYFVTKFDENSETFGTEMMTDNEGKLVIRGIPSEKDALVNGQAQMLELTIMETEAPAGYKKLMGTKTMNVTKISETVTVTSTTEYFDENGNKVDSVTSSYKSTVTFNSELQKVAITVVNEKGLPLPETGGTGTTLFYVIGSVMMLGAAILLVTKKRMAK